MLHFDILNLIVEYLDTKDACNLVLALNTEIDIKYRIINFVHDKQIVPCLRLSRIKRIWYHILYPSLNQYLLNKSNTIDIIYCNKLIYDKRLLNFACIKLPFAKIIIRDSFLHGGYVLRRSGQMKNFLSWLKFLFPDISFTNIVYNNCGYVSHYRNKIELANGDIFSIQRFGNTTIYFKRKEEHNIKVEDNKQVYYVSSLNYHCHKHCKHRYCDKCYGIGKSIDYVYIKFRLSYGNKLL